VKVIASIEDPDVIKKILEHLKKKDDTQEAVQLPDARPIPEPAPVTMSALSLNFCFIMCFN